MCWGHKTWTQVPFSLASWTPIDHHHLLLTLVIDRPVVSAIDRVLWWRFLSLSHFLCNVAASLEASRMHQGRGYLGILHAVTEGIFVLHFYSYRIAYRSLRISFALFSVFWFRVLSQCYSNKRRAQWWHCFFKGNPWSREAYSITSLFGSIHDKGTS